jgi:hypothetical protein
MGHSPGSSTLEIEQILSIRLFYRQSATKGVWKPGLKSHWISDLGVPDLSLSSLIDRWLDVHGYMLTCPLYTGHEIDSGTYVSGAYLSTATATASTTDY